LDEQVEQKPTPEGGASTLDRLERYLAAEDATGTTKQEPKAQADEGPADTAADNSGTDDGAPDKDAQPQLTTADIAKYLGVEDSILDVDDDGTIKVKTKIDGKEVTPKLSDLIKSYQVQGYADNRAREVAKQEEALRARNQEAEQHFKQRLEAADRLALAAEADLMAQFRGIDWNSLAQNDPGRAALVRQQFQERAGQIQAIKAGVRQGTAELDESAKSRKADGEVKERERLLSLVPEWKDASVFERERVELLDWVSKAGFDAGEIEAALSSAPQVAVMRRAMLHDKLQASKPAIENKVRTAPKLVKPGQNTAVDSKTQMLRNLKTQVKASGGKRGIAEWLIATGKV
jgi:hypothetical protein